MSFSPPTDKQARLIWLALTGLAIATLVGLITALIWGLSQVLQILSPVIWPLAVGGILAYLLDPVVDYFQKKGLSRPRAIISVFGIAVLILAAVFGSVVPQLVTETRQFGRSIPRYVATVETKVQNWATNPPPVLRELLKLKSKPSGEPDAAVETNNAAPSVSTNSVAPAAESAANTGGLGGAFDKETLQSATNWLAKSLPQVGRWLFGQVGRVASWFGVLVGLALVPIYAFYLLLEKRRIELSWTDYLPMADSEFKDELVFILRSINSYLIAFFRGQVLVAICDGVLYTIGFLIIGLPYAILLGVAAIALTIIPFLGAIIIFLTALVIAFAQFGDWQHPLLVVCVFAVVQTLEGVVISPKIMGDRVGLHPLAIIIAVMAGTTLLGGVLGGILAIPLTAVLRVLMQRYVWKRRKAAETASP